MATYHLMVEHTGGASVDHPCTRGTWPDPADNLDCEVEAVDEEEAEGMGFDILRQLCQEHGECECSRRLSPGGNRWWDSVVVIVTKVED